MTGNGAAESSAPKIDIHRVFAAPQEGLSEPEFGLALLPEATLEASGGVVPCHFVIRQARWFDRSEVWVTATVVSPPAAIL